MRTVLLLASAYVRQNRWFALVLLLWPWLFTVLLRSGGENQLGDYAAVLQQESFYGIAITMFLTTAALNNEQRSRRIVAVLAKAIGRGQYLISLLMGILFLVLCFLLSLGAATWVAIGPASAGPNRLILFLAVVLVFATWVASFALMMSTVVHPLFATILTGIAATAPLLRLRFAEQGWTAIVPTLPILSALMKDPLSAEWRINMAPVCAALFQALVFVGIAAWTFRYRDLTRAIE